MKKLALVWLIMASATASNYPADYCQEKVYSKVEGPSLLVKVTSGCTKERYVIGYKYGYEFDYADSIDAVVNYKCHESRHPSNAFNKIEVVKLNKEWNGTGFMSAHFSGFTFYSHRSPYYCVPESVAFSVGEHWDSKFGQNYKLKDLKLSYKAKNLSYSTSGSFHLDVWNHIVNLMR